MNLTDDQISSMRADAEQGRPSTKTCLDVLALVEEVERHRHEAAANASIPLRLVDFREWESHELRFLVSDLVEDLNTACDDRLREAKGEDWATFVSRAHDDAVERVARFNRRRYFVAQFGEAQLRELRTGDGTVEDIAARLGLEEPDGPGFIAVRTRPTPESRPTRPISDERDALAAKAEAGKGLVAYATHKPRCASRYEARRCDCGLDAALARWEAANG